MSETGRPRLLEKIRDEIRRKGPISFARFMELALYDPEDGYYSASADRIGLEGDYYTSPDVHPLFGRMLGRQMAQMRALLPENEPFTLLEAGAGKGLLCRDLLTALRGWQGEGARDIRYRVVERSGAMVFKQKELLRSAGLAEQVDWFPGLGEAGADGPFTGCILSNELVDALPVHRVGMTQEGLSEFFVDWKENRLVELAGPPSTPELQDYFDRSGLRLSPGQRAEVGLEAERWMRKAGSILGRGFVITIDYGHPASELFGPHRKKGSLLCYHRHTVNDNPFARVGEQDITAHVDFTALGRAGAEAGLSVTGFTNQLNFLMGLGIAEETEKMDPEGPDFLSAKRLLARESMGGVFKVLIQHKGLAVSPNLDGLAFRPFRMDPLGFEEAPEVG